MKSDFQALFLFCGVTLSFWLWVMLLNISIINMFIIIKILLPGSPCIQYWLICMSCSHIKTLSHLLDPEVLQLNLHLLHAHFFFWISRIKIFFPAAPSSHEVRKEMSYWVRTLSCQTWGLWFECLAPSWKVKLGYLSLLPIIGRQKQVVLKCSLASHPDFSDEISV